MSGPTQYGFDFGPMCVERVAHDERLGWVVTIRSSDSYSPQVVVRCSPKGNNWSASVTEDIKVSLAAAVSETTP